MVHKLNPLEQTREYLLEISDFILVKKYPISRKEFEKEILDKPQNEALFYLTLKICEFFDENYIERNNELSDYQMAILVWNIFKKITNPTSIPYNPRKLWDVLLFKDLVSFTLRVTA